MVGWMPCWSHRSEIGVCSRRWSRRMATFSWAVKRLRVFLGMGEPPLEVVAYSSRRFVPFQLKQDRTGTGRTPHDLSPSDGPEYRNSYVVDHITVPLRLAGQERWVAPSDAQRHPPDEAPLRQPLGRSMAESQ